MFVLVETLSLNERVATGYVNTMYRPKEEAVNDISMADGLKITLFHAEWCYMCEMTVPSLNNIFIALPETVTLQFVELNYKKKDPEGLANLYKVSRIPTVVLEYDGVEIGRLVETAAPEPTWEEAMARIVTDKVVFE